MAKVHPAFRANVRSCCINRWDRTIGQLRHSAETATISRANTDKRPMKKANYNLTAAMAVSGLMVFTAGHLRADNEPDDNFIENASPIEITPIGDDSEPSEIGRISNSDTDYYSILNSKGYSKIVISYQFSGSSPDTTRFRVIGPDGIEELANEITDSNTYSASYTVDSSMKGDMFYICIEGDSADGNKGYTLEVIGSPDVDAIAKKVAKKKKLIKKKKKLRKKLKKLKKRKHRNRALERIYKKRIAENKKRIAKKKKQIKALKAV